MDYDYPSVPPGHDPIQGENEPDWHFADRLAFREKALSVRWGGSVHAAELRKEGSAEERDMKAYAALRAQGYQPATINGSADRAARATEDADVCVKAAKRKDQTTLADAGLALRPTHGNV